MQNHKFRFPIPNYRKKGENVASLYLYQTKDNIKKSFNGKNKVSVWKWLKSFGPGIGLIMHIAELIGNKNWKSAWLILLPDRKSWYTIQRIYWRKALEKSKELPVNNNLNVRSNQNNGCRSAPNLKDSRNTRALSISLELSKKTKTLSSDSRTRTIASRR